MKKLQLATFAKRFESTEATLTRLLCKREGIRVDHPSDAAGEAQSSLERELTAVALDRESSLLSDVRLAAVKSARSD